MVCSMQRLRLWNACLQVCVHGSRKESLFPDYTYMYSSSILSRRRWEDSQAGTVGDTKNSLSSMPLGLHQTGITGIEQRLTTHRPSRSRLSCVYYCLTTCSLAGWLSAGDEPTD